MTAPGPWDWAQGYLAPTVGTGPGPSYARPTIAGLLNGPLNRPTPIGSDPAMWRSVGGPAIWLANTMNPVSDINDAVTGSERFSQGLLGGSWKEAASGLIDFAGGLLGMAVPGHYSQYKQAVDEGADVVRRMIDDREVPDTLYHVVGDGYQEGQPLRSLYDQHGDNAYDMFAEKWPEAGDAALDHPHRIFFYDTEEAARDHAEEFGGRVVKVDPSLIDDESLRFDTQEAPGYWVSLDRVPPEALSK